MKKCVYTGPSWAELSYEPREDFDRWPNYTNLALEWNLNCENTSRRAYNNFDCIDQVRKYDGAVVWVFCEPLVAILHNMPLQRQYLRVKDHLSFRHALLMQQLDAMNRMGRPIGIIGAHSDIRKEDLEGFSNLEILDSSWQNFLAQHVDKYFQPHYNWGYEIAHVIMQVNKDIEPSEQLVNDVFEGFEFWKYLERRGVFCDVHPNRLGNELYAKHTQDIVKKFIERY
jgi:hypothetical protein